MTASERPHLEVTARIDDNLRVARAPSPDRSSGSAFALGRATVLVGTRQAPRRHWLDRACARRCARYAARVPRHSAANPTASSSRKTPRLARRRQVDRRSYRTPCERQRAGADPRNAHVPSRGVRRLQRRYGVRRGAHRGWDRDRAPSYARVRGVAGGVPYVERGQREAPTVTWTPPSRSFTECAELCRRCDLLVGEMVTRDRRFYEPAAGEATGRPCRVVPSAGRQRLSERRFLDPRKGVQAR